MGVSTVTRKTELLITRLPTHNWRRLRALVVALGSTLTGLLGCHNDTTGPASIAPSAAYWALQLNHRAVMLALPAPYDTVQLQATALTAFGTPLAGGGVGGTAVTYTVNDSTLQVSATGLVTARYSTQGRSVPVVASLTVQGVTLTDTAIVQVTDTAPRYPLATFSIQANPTDADALPRDTLPVDWNGNKQTGSTLLPVYITTTHGDSVCTVLNTYGPSCPIVVAWRSSNPTVALFYQGGLIPRTLGQTTIYATTDAYGVVMQDSLVLTIGYPAGQIPLTVQEIIPLGSPTPVYRFVPSTLRIGVGATVHMIAFSATDSMDLVFEDPTAVSGAFGGPSGNVPPITTTTVEPGGFFAGIALRRFNVAGTYPYHSVKLGISGEIIVQ